SSDYANPAAGVWVEKTINEENVQLRWYNLADAQNAYMFNLEVYANVEITAKQVVLTTAVSPEEAAGSVNVYPVSTSYDEGTELKMTATENFGYDFENWTNAAGDILSKEPVFTYIINADETLTANFKKVDTYELAIAVEGGANDYMIALNPAPTIVDDKNMYEAGTVVELAASSNPILTFANWGDGQTNGTISVTMDADKAITAVYSAEEYIVGWDFIKRGNNGRPADFASTVDNETAAIILTTADGKVSGWLDKSKEAAGGYESFVGAAVNWQALTDKYYYQTKINASEFMNIKVQAEMMYNYNAYQKQLIEYSIDGTTWTTAGEATMPGVKTGTPISATLPAEANNATELYIRFIPDYTSNIDGTESDNDGTTITNIFIFGEKKIVDDGVAPVFVSSVPTNDATGASATGKIVLNFDEKIKLTEAANATLNGKAIEGSVTGKSITFPYVGLEYNTQYSFVLAAGSVADLTDNTLAEAITINFTTMNRPSVAKGEYDAIVTNITELRAALNKATGNARFRIFLHNGTYDFGTSTLTNVKGNVSLIGESTEGTILRNDPQAEGISVTAILCTGGENIYMQDLTLMSTDYERPGNNGEGGSIGRCVVLQENASKAVYKNVNLLSHQDTYYTRATQRAYWEGGKIAGTVDYLCGGGDIFFNGVTLYNNARSNGDCITAPATSSKWGYVFSNCTIDGDKGQDGRYSLGRPWQSSPRAVYINTTMKILPTGAGWSDMGAVPGLFAEYNSHTESGAMVDCSARKTSFTVDGVSHTVKYNPVLTQAEVEQYTIDNVVGGSDNWQPQLLTEQAPTPTNVTLYKGDNTLKWDNNEYALLWAVCKNGKVVAFTTEPIYTVDDATATWSVRAANEMGG
ncbi:MAG: Ig-like domain-containing protein, partial [Prevotella sp.]|nr:Ig-like domain-containing protein [Prevotella sp.]